MLCITELAEHSSNDVELKGAPGFVYASFWVNFISK